MNVQDVDPLIQTLYRVFDVAGVFIMGIIGGTIARQRGFDIVGFLFIALFSALGGGMIRDVLINRGTVAAMATPEYLILAFAGALVARLVYFKGTTWERFQFHGDAIISSLWAATGCIKAVSYGLPVLACIMMGVFTAVGGGMIRDVVTGGIPSVFGSNQPTVIPAVACTTTVLIANHFDVLAIGVIVGPLLSFGLTVYGYWTGWRLNADSEWAPVNRAVSKMERESRKIAREVEPRRLRAWRHQMMERALERRRDRGQVPVDTSAVDEVVEAIEREELAREQSSGVGFDFGGDSYDNYDADTQRDHAGEEFQEPSTPSSRTLEDLIDLVLTDELLTDELLDRLANKNNKPKD
ncbi:trimeric intracellular cation channel family protein [Corynebacterium uterequi]|uniref:Putative membrane protein n=1 Tax=Corynebacterium uterequi TaxID=1072256 RepID=A0A0G3HE16_9CORY|nr:trimeric intracellular cation channel family protein [Corynebacterium uterequi]AKK11554.1 putative membrane protein [Corynebacterium uterequi]